MMRRGLKYQSTQLKENPLGLLIRYWRKKKEHKQTHFGKQLVCDHLGVAGIPDLLSAK